MHLVSVSLGRRILSGVVLSFALALVAVKGQIVQTNHGTGTEEMPGAFTISSTDLLQTQLASATRTGTNDGASFYREDGGYEVDLSRLSDGDFGTFGSSGLGGDGHYTVMPNNVTITFTFDTSVNTQGYAISEIRTFASWDDGRDGQAYEVQYATVGAPSTFYSLYTITRFDNENFPSHLEYDSESGEDVEVFNTDIANTVVQLTHASGNLATNVSSLRFIFSGVENSGTAYREFDVTGTAVSAIPEPSTYGLIAGAAGLLLASWRRRMGVRV